MGTGAFVLTCIFSAIGSLLLMFPIAALAVRGHRRIKLPWGKGFALLGLTVVLVSVVNLIAFSIEPSLLNSREMSGAGMALDFLAPLGISVGVLLLLWHPARPKTATHQNIDKRSVTRSFGLNTPFRRAWFIVLVFGLLLCGGTYLVFESQHSYPDFANAIFDRPRRYWGYKISMLIGAAAMALGLVFSVFYDHSIAPLVRWVNGTSRDAP